MDSKVPLYISAVALFVAVLASLFFFNAIQKMKKVIKDAKIDKNTLINMSEKFDKVDSEVSTIFEEIERIKTKIVTPLAVPQKSKHVPVQEPEQVETTETLVVEEEDSDDDSEIEIDEN